MFGKNVGPSQKFHILQYGVDSHPRSEKQANFYILQHAPQSRKYRVGALVRPNTLNKIRLCPRVRSTDVRFTVGKSRGYYASELR